MKMQNQEMHRARECFINNDRGLRSTRCALLDLRDSRSPRFPEPPGSHPASFINGRLARGGPRDETIGTDKHGAQTQFVLRLAADIGDAVFQAICQRSKRLVGIEIEQKALAGSEIFAKPRPIDQLEIRHAAAHQRMAIAKVMAQRAARRSPSSLLT